MKEPVTDILRTKAEQVRTGAEMLMSKTRDWQVIRQYLSNRMNDIELTATQQRKLERYQFIYAQLVSGKYSKQEVISQVINLYKIKIQQVYDDLSCTQEIFSTVVNINKQFEMQIQLEIAKDMLRKCNEIGDIKTGAQVQKNIIALQALLPDEVSSPGEDFEGHTIEVVFDPRMLGGPDIDMNELLQSINSKRKVHIKTDMFQDIPFTPTNDGSKEATL